MSVLETLPHADAPRLFPAAGQLAERADGLLVEVVRTREAFDGLAQRWQDLEQRAEGALVFQSCGWARAIFDFEAARGNADFEPVVVTLSDEQRLLAVLPLERIRTRMRTVLAPLGHAFSQYSDVLIGPGLDPRDTVARLLRTAIKAAPCDAVSFLKVRSDSQLARGMPANHLITGEEQGAPYVSLDAFADYGAYFHTIKAKTRKNMRNARNRLERDGAVSHHIAETEQAKLGIVERTLGGRAGRLRDQGLTSRAFSDTAFTDFCTSMVGRADMDFMAMSLRHHGEPIAEQWGFIHKQRYYAFVASRDFSHSDESPGKLHLGEVIHACAERGLHGADLMVPVMPYKLTWATEVVTVRDYALPVTPRGVLVLNVWDRWLRPLLKKTVLGLSPHLRSMLLKLAGRSL